MFLLLCHLGERPAAGHAEELEHVVEAARVGHAVLDDRVEQLEVVAVEGAVHEALARAHQVLVAAQRVDLAVVGEISEQ